MMSSEKSDIDAELERMFRSDPPPAPRPDLAARVVTRIRHSERQRRWIVLLGVAVGVSVSLLPLIELASMLGGWLGNALAPLAAMGIPVGVDGQSEWLVLAIVAAFGGPVIHAVVEQ